MEKCLLPTDDYLVGTSIVGLFFPSNYVTVDSQKTYVSSFYIYGFFVINKHIIPASQKNVFNQGINQEII